MATLSEKASKVVNILNHMGIEYTIITHKKVFTMDEIKSEGIDKENKMAKNLFLRNAKGDKHYLVCIKKDKQADLNKLKNELQSTRLSFASEKRLSDKLDLAKGEVSPFGIINNKESDVIVAFDKELLLLNEVGFHPNDNSATVFIKPVDIKRVIENNSNKILFIEV